MLRNLRPQCLRSFSPKTSLTFFDQKLLSAGLTYDGNHRSTHNDISESVLLPSQSQIVIAGAGIVANSVAYHLVASGWSDVLVVEQDHIGTGSSHFGSGTLGLFKPIAHRNLISYSIKLYRQLEEMGYDIGLRQCGSISLAQTKDRMIALRRRMAYNVPTGLHCEVRTELSYIELNFKLREIVFA